MSTQGSIPSISVENVVVHYGEVLALSGVNANVYAGKVTALIGINGSGKSTLFKTMMGLIRPDQGTVHLNGCTPLVARKKGLVSYVPQNEDIDWRFPISVRDVVMMGRYGFMGPSRRAGTADHQAVDSALERVELSDLAHRQIGQLSGGQKKRAFLARGIAQGAEIILLDEPFAGVDKRSEATISHLLKSLAKEGRCVLVSTHDLVALPSLAEEAIVLLRRVLFQGSVDEALRPEVLVKSFGLDPFSGGKVA